MKPYPFLCDIPYFFKYLKNSENKHAYIKWADVEIGGVNFNKTTVMFPNY